MKLRLWVLLVMTTPLPLWGDETYGSPEEKSSGLPTPKPTVSEQGVWRQPVRAILSESQAELLVLCQRDPSLVVIPLADPSKKSVFPLPGKPEAITLLPGGKVAIAESLRNQVLIVDFETANHRRQAVDVGDDPRELLLSNDRTILWVSCRADQKLQAIDPSAGRTLWQVELPFPPHSLAEDRSGELLAVADAFRGHIATLNAKTGEIITIHRYPATNIRGLAFTPNDQELLFTHQIISENSMIERESVRWGAFITNNVRRIPRGVLLDPSADAVVRSELGFVGGFGHGAGDPGKLLYAREGRVLVCLAGVNEIGIDTGWPLRFDRIHVGRRPVDLAVDREAKTAYVVNMFDDAISIIDLNKQQVVGSISLGSLPEETPAMRGEILFHDASLSLDNWYSCQSCHTDGDSNNSNADTFSDGGFGSPKNTPSLRGVAQTGPWSWVGKFQSLEEQVASTIEHTMQSNRVSRRMAADLAAYLATLEPRPTRPASADPKIADGRLVFEKQGCAECHAGERLTKDSLEDVGMDDGLAGHHLFNPPSLRSVKQTAPYFHDGRAKSLEEVIDRFGHRIQEPLSNDSRAALMAYLKSL